MVHGVLSDGSACALPLASFFQTVQLVDMEAERKPQTISNLRERALVSFCLLVAAAAHHVYVENSGGGGGHRLLSENSLTLTPADLHQGDMFPLLALHNSTQMMGCLKDRLFMLCRSFK